MNLHRKAKKTRSLELIRSVEVMREGNSGRDEGKRIEKKCITQKSNKNSKNSSMSRGLIITYMNKQVTNKKRKTFIKSLILISSISKGYCFEN